MEVELTDTIEIELRADCTVDNSLLCAFTHFDELMQHWSFTCT
jgi:hypothetical protein